MNADNIPNVNPVQPTSPGTKAPGTVGNEDAAFRSMLERLEAIAKAQSDAPHVENAEDFLEALQKADTDFMSAMDLRKQLEDAYRNRQP